VSGGKGRTMKSTALAISLLLGTSSLALAQFAPPPVYAGCAVPPSTYTNTWYIDPVNGNDATGNGSQSAPWKTAQSLVSTGTWGSPRLSTVPYWHAVPNVGWFWTPNANAPVHPGDLVLLASGNHGTLDVGIHATGHVIENGSAWLTIAAAPGATPVFTSIQMEGVDNVRISGVKVQNTVAGGKTLINVASPLNPTHDIVLDHLAVNSSDANDGWSTTAAFIAAAGTGMYLDDAATTSCVSATNNHLSNLLFGAEIGSSNGLFANNEIDHIGADAIDVGGAPLTIQSNYIHDMQPVEPTLYHPDMIQGQGSWHNPPGGSYTGLVIDSNIGIRQVDPNLSPIAPFALVQGIDAFDADWTDVRITRNVVVTSSCWSMSWAHSHGALFAQNTLAWDGYAPGVTNPSTGKEECGPTLNPYTGSHEFSGGGDHIVAVNNIAHAAYDYLESLTPASPPPPASAMTNNLVTAGSFAYWTTGPIFTAKPGVYQGNALLAVDPPAGVFRTFNRAAWQFDLHLAPGSPAIGLGIPETNAAMANLAAWPDLVLPAVDVEGTAYSATTPSAGAYAYTPAPVCTQNPPE
jgi:hypothetical protein